MRHLVVRPVSFSIVLAVAVVLTNISEVTANTEQSTSSDTLVAYIDTTRTREVQEKPKSLGETVATVPGFILGLPFKVLELATKGVVYGVYETPLKNLGGLGNPIAPLFVVAGYGENLGIKGGLGFRLNSLFGASDRFTVKSYYSTHDYQSLQMKYRAADFPVKSASFYFESRYTKRPWESFHGISMDSNTDDEVSYTPEKFFLFGRIERKLGSRTAISLSGGYTSTNIFDGEKDDRVGDIDSIQVLFDLHSDYFRPTRYLTVGTGVELSWLDSKGQPSQGTSIGLEASYNHGVGRSSDLKFLRLRGEIDRFFNIWKKRIIALRITAERHDNVANERSTPFYLLSSLGGNENLRGYRENRFVDNDFVTATIEYRWPIWKVIDAYLFLDEGRTFGNVPDEFTLDGWRYSYGGGLRVWNNDGVTLVVGLGRSEEETRFYLDLGASW